MNQARI